jgi:uncharacterized membrane protein YwzB
MGATIIFFCKAMWGLQMVCLRLYDSGLEKSVKILIFLQEVISIKRSNFFFNISADSKST